MVDEAKDIPLSKGIPQQEVDEWEGKWFADQKFVDGKLVPGEDRYEVLETIAEKEGEEIVVLKAWDEKTKREVALKVFIGDDPSERERFRREAKTLVEANVIHRYVVRVYDYLELRPAIVMEYMERGTLQDFLGAISQAIEYHDFLLIDNFFSLPKFLGILERVAEALDFLADKGIIHSDVKPGNIFVNEEGDAKLGDFNISSAVLRKGIDTLEGTVIGAPGYRAPEVEAGGWPTRASDIYSFGVVIYRLLSGWEKKLEPGVTIASLWITKSFRPFSLSDSSLEKVDFLLRKAMSDEPEERPKTAKELVEQLREAVREEVAREEKWREEFMERKRLSQKYKIK